MNLSAPPCDFTAQCLFSHLYMAISKAYSQDKMDNTVNCSEPNCLRTSSVEAGPGVGILVKVIFSEPKKRVGEER